jgi:uncharacterized membrane protein
MNSPPGSDTKEEESAVSPSPGELASVQSTHSAEQANPQNPEALQKELEPQIARSPIPPNILAQLLGPAPGIPLQGNSFMFQPPQAQLRVWQGQFPPPEAVEHYDKVLPGTFNRLITMTEKLLDAQIAEAKEIRTFSNSETTRGQILGTVTTWLAMAGALVCAYLGQPWVAGGFLGVPVMAVARSLIESSKKEKASDVLKAAQPKNSPPTTG